MVGHAVPLLTDLTASEGVWLSREPSGYTNIVKQGDALPLPPGHLPVHRDMLIQRGDFVRRDHAWIGTTPDEWGTSVGTRLVVRPQPHGGAGC
jgi:hypothetical protein